MIFFRKQLYINSWSSLLNMTHVFMTSPLSYDPDYGSFILIQNSTFFNLNAHTNVTALAIYEATIPLK